VIDATYLIVPEQQGKDRIMLLFTHPTYTFDRDESKNLLRMTWTPQTESMTLDDFKEALHNLAGFAFDSATHGILVDVRQFRFRPGPELGDWRDEVISPRYVRAGVKRFAYLAPVGLIEQMKSGMQSVQRGFDEDYFDDEAKALAWLTR
jgi:SpoIIAA-like